MFPTRANPAHTISQPRRSCAEQELRDEAGAQTIGSVEIDHR